MALKRLQEVPLLAEASGEWAADFRSGKRRRFSLEEVDDGLCARGLDQPILAMLQTAAAQKRPASSGQEAITGDEAAAMKRRRRTTLDALPQGMPGTCDLGASPLSWAIAPYRPPGNFGKALRRPARSLAVDPLGIVFVVADPGFFWAEMPVGTRPLIRLNDESVAEIAKVAVSFDGTAYLLSDKDQLLTVVPASMCLEDCRKNAMSRGCLTPCAGDDGELKGLKLFTNGSQGDASMETEAPGPIIEPAFAEDVGMVVD